MPPIIGLINIVAIGVTQTIINTMYNNLSLFVYHALAFSGNSATKIFEPSSGGNGIKLNTPSPTFIAIIYLIINASVCPTGFVIANINPNLKYSANIIENIIAKYAEGDNCKYLNNL